MLYDEFGFPVSRHVDDQVEFYDFGIKEYVTLRNSEASSAIAERTVDKCESYNFAVTYLKLSRFGGNSPSLQLLRLNS